MSLEKTRRCEKPRILEAPYNLSGSQPVDAHAEVAPMQPYDTFIGDANGHLTAIVPGETEDISREKAAFIVHSVNFNGEKV